MASSSFSSRSSSTPSSLKRRVTLKDVSTKADLSVSAVSMALADHPTISQQTKQRVLHICHELGYTKPGQHQAALPEAYLQNREIGFVVVSKHFDDPTYSPLLHSMAVMAQSRGARVQLAAVQSENPQKAVRPIMELGERVHGMMLLGYVDRALLTHLTELETPMIVLGMLMHPTHEPLPEKLSLVSPDELGMGRLATAALIKQGHKRVAYICEVLSEGQSHQLWLQGYQLAHLHAGVPLLPQMVHVSGTVNTGGEPAAAAFSKMNEPPTAVVVPDAPMARTFLDACKKHGLPMEESAVICGGHPQRAREYDVEHCGRIFCEPDRLISSGLDLLTRKMRGEAVSRMSILLHPTCENFPAEAEHD